MSIPIRVLMVEDSAADAELILDKLADHGFDVQVQRVETEAAYLAALDSVPDVILADHRLPQFSGPRALDLLNARGLDIPFIAVSGTLADEQAVELIKQGACDFVLKDRMARLGPAVTRALDLKQARDEQRRSQQALAESEEKFRSVIASTPNAVVMINSTGNTILWSPAAEKIFGYSQAEILGNSLADYIVPQRFRESHTKGYQRFLLSGKGALIGNTTEVTAVHKNGMEFPVELFLSAVNADGKRHALGIMRDISERKRAERALIRQKELYEVLSQTDQTIVRGLGRDALFQAVCRITVEYGRFRFAWIGLIDESASGLKPIARYGEDAGYIDASLVLTNATAGNWPGLAVRTLLSGNHVISNDFLNESATASRHEAAARAGVRAAAKFPISQGGAVIGAISLYADEANFFTADLISTLDEMASDVSFALDNLAREAVRERAEADLRAAEEQFRGLVEQSIAGIYIVQDGKLVYVNPRLLEIFGYASSAELIGRDPNLLVAQKDRPTVAGILGQRIKGEDQVQTIEFSFSAARKDGTMIEVGAHGAFATYRGRPAVIGLMQDISEKARAEKQIQRYIEQLKAAFMSTVEVATSLSELRDPYTAGHERRVGALAAALGAELGLDVHQQEGLRVAGYLHDIGKFIVPAEILSKPGKLSPIEFMLIQGHPQSGYDVLKNVRFPWPVAEVALQHHERMDGSGYPQGLKGEATLLEARILAVADVIEAMSSHRPYRAALGIDAALKEIERGRGTAYDPVVADACLKLFRETGYAIPA